MLCTVFDIDLFFQALRNIAAAPVTDARAPPEAFFHQAMALRSIVHEERRRSAARFNIFESIGKAYDETLHSRFLAYLLDPHALHDQGTLPLESFLTTVGLRHLLPPGTTAEQTSVWTEWPVPDGRIDIGIFVGHSTIICIENKIWASEQLNQISRYQQWLSDVTHGSTHTAIIFLTPEARIAKSAQVESQDNVIPVVPISYGTISMWLAQLEQQVPGRLALLLEMYGDICQQIHQTASGSGSAKTTDDWR